MPAWSGKCDGRACTFTFDEVTATITPAGATAIAFDLGDIDRVFPGEWDLRLELYTGQALLLSHFGAAFSDMTRDFLEAWRRRTIQCLLLEDLEEIAHYSGAANGSAAEIRIFQSNLAILPLNGLPLQ